MVDSANSNAFFLSVNTLNHSKSKFIECEFLIIFIIIIIFFLLPLCDQEEDGMVTRKFHFSDKCCLLTIIPSRVL